jgi:outer membrane immunogenic protein
MRIFAVTALALTAAATPALAQDGSFQGPRVEVIAGWDRAETVAGGASGFTYGGAVGYDLQRGTSVFGVDAEVTGSTADECFGGACLKAGRDLYIGGRLGAVIAPNTLVYAKAGYTNARMIGETSTAHDAVNLDGYRVGAGVERAFGPYYGKIEYRYSSYSQDVERHQVLAGIGYRF